MLKDIVEVRPLGGHRVYVRFEDGVAGEVDFAQRLRFTGGSPPRRILNCSRKSGSRSSWVPSSGPPAPMWIPTACMPSCPEPHGGWRGLHREGGDSTRGTCRGVP